MSDQNKIKWAEEREVFGACRYVDATGRMTCEDGMTADECSDRNGTFFPNQQCMDLSKHRPNLSSVQIAAEAVAGLKPEGIRPVDQVDGCH